MRKGLGFVPTTASMTTATPLVGRTRKWPDVTTEREQTPHARVWLLIGTEVSRRAKLSRKKETVGAPCSETLSLRIRRSGSLSELRHIRPRLRRHSGMRRHVHTRNLFLPTLVWRKGFRTRRSRGVPDEAIADHLTRIRSQQLAGRANWRHRRGASAENFPLRCRANHVQ